MVVSTMQQIQQQIEQALKKNKAEDIMVAFDIDMTLTQPDHPAVYYPTLLKYRKIYNNIVRILSPPQKDLTHTLTTQLYPQRLVEGNIPVIIKALEEKGIRVIAFTAALTGQFEENQDKLIFLRKAQLQKKGLDFTRSFQDITSMISFTDFPLYAGLYPMFYEGVLSSNGEGLVTKGQVLCAFLRHIGIGYEQKTGESGYFPKVIFLIDDRKKNLEDVQASLKAWNPSIEFVGIEYQGAFSYAPHLISEEDFKKFWITLTEKARSTFDSSFVEFRQNCHGAFSASQ